MPTRRRFLFAASAATAMSGIRQAYANENAALPPAIAALRDRRAEAQPITLAEREARLERARALMKENKLDAIALAGGTSLDYFTGISWGNSERLFACVLPQKGRPFYVCPAFEEDRAREAMAHAPSGKESKILTWQEDQDPYALVARGLRDASVSTGRVGIEERVPFVFSEGIRKSAHGIELTSATPVTAGCRMVKSPAELKLMQLANDITWQVYEVAWRSIHPGMTNRQFSALIEAAYHRTGFQGDASCQVDAWSALPHGSREPQVIREGSIVLIDDGCEVEGYQSDISRTFVIGKPTDKTKRVFDAVHKAQAAALHAAKPGVQCQAVDAAARKMVEDAGFGSGYAHFTHRVGHGIGLDGHEWPYLVKGNAQPLAANMTTSDEPGIYLRGEFGVRLEDDMYITPDGAKWFTPQSNSLEEPFAR
jgi:Xaa-Pro aminopeptidase